MAVTNAAHTLGPEDAKLTVRTGKSGAASKAGHNLLLEVTSWNATLELGGEPALTLIADSKSMRVLDGSGGVKALDGDDKTNIEQTIDDEVLKGGAIGFHSTAVSMSDGRLSVAGELDLLGSRGPLSFELAIGDDGRLTGEAVIKQTEFGIKPYSALFGALKVADEIRIAIDGRLPGDIGGS